MTDPDEPTKHSPLSQSVTQDGKTVSIEIYEDGDGGWLLEVIDEYGTSTVWDDPFATDQEALVEALKTIDEDGIDSLIVPPVKGERKSVLDHDLSDLEIEELDDFLAGEVREETSMDVSSLEGCLRVSCSSAAPIRNIHLICFVTCVSTPTVARTPISC